MSLKIIGLGKGVPKRQVSNGELTSFINTSDQWILSRTGIKSRPVCTDETLTDLSTTAAAQAMQNAGLEASDVDMIICSTIGSDYRTPSLACGVAERLGAVCPAFDINAACAGFIYALDMASAFLAGGRKNVLIICAEMMSAHVDWTDRNTCVLFGDGAAACVVAEGDALQYIRISATPSVGILHMPSNPGNSPFRVKQPEGDTLHMQGQEVFRFAVHTVETEAARAVESLAVPLEQVDYFVLHQANKRILDSAREKLGQPEAKFPTNIERYGNISSVSIPLLLLEMQEDGRLKPGVTLFMSAFGAGLVTGSCVMVWE